MTDDDRDLAAALEELIADAEHDEDACWKLIDLLEDTDAPALLNIRAAAYRWAAQYAIPHPGELFQAAADDEARAEALRQVAGGQTALTAAEDEVAAAEEAFARAGEPEKEAARREVDARTLLGRARDALEQARQRGAEPAELVTLTGEVAAAEAVHAHEARNLEAAQLNTAAAKPALDVARQRVRDARAGLDAARAVKASGKPSDREVINSMEYSWPARGAEAARGEAPLSPEEMYACKMWAGVMADLLGVTPRGAEARMKEGIARDIAAATCGSGTFQVKVDGRLITLAQVPNVPSGSTILSTVAQGR